MTLRLAGTLVRFANFTPEFVITANTVGEALEDLVKQHPDLKSKLFDRTGKISSTHRLFLNNQQLNGNVMVQPLAENDNLYVLTAVAGG